MARSRFVEFDLVDRLAPYLTPIFAQLVIAVAGSVLAVLARMVVDLVFPFAGPFALTFPFVLFATLYGRWQAGVGVMCFCALFAWFFVLPTTGSFTFENTSDGPRVLINVLSGFLIVAMAEYFRKIVRSALLERNAIAEEKSLLLDELDHRVKNNFAMVGATIRIEMRSCSEDALASLKAIAGRVESISRAHAHLYRNDGGGGEVPMRPYLVNLCGSLKDAYLGDGHTIVANIQSIGLPRDTAIAIGLVVNELCMNAAKHAFAGQNDGSIKVELTATDDLILVSIADDGIGFTEGTARTGSLGQGLVGAFAEQAGGHLEKVDAPVGTRYELKIPMDTVSASNQTTYS